MRAVRQTAGAVLLLMAASCSCACSVASAEEAHLTVHVSGWHCAMCPGKTEAAVKKVKGVRAAAADFDKKTLSVTYDNHETGQRKIEKAVVASGFQVAT